MTKQEFDQLQIEMELSGKSLKSFMASKELPVHQYYYWRKKYNMTEASNLPNGFVHLGPSQQVVLAIRLEYPNGVTINFQYPNPSSGIFHISIPDNLEYSDVHIYVYDLNGRDVLRLNNHRSSNIKVDLNDFQAGYYLLKLVTGRKTYSKMVQLIK